MLSRPSASMSLRQIGAARNAGCMSRFDRGSGVRAGSDWEKNMRPDHRDRHPGTRSAAASYLLRIGPHGPRCNSRTAGSRSRHVNATEVATRTAAVVGDSGLGTFNSLARTAGFTADQCIRMARFAIRVHLATHLTAQGWPAAVCGAPRWARVGMTLGTGHHARLQHSRPVRGRPRSSSLLITSTNAGCGSGGGSSAPQCWGTIPVEV